MAKLPRIHTRPEAKIQKEIEEMLRRKGWYVVRTHGNVYQSGLPDIFATHKVFGHRWIEVKIPSRRGDIFTPAQHAVFPELNANGSGVWILVAATNSEYEKLKARPNWWSFLQVAH